MAGASVLFLGTGDAFCNGGRLHTAFHVAADGYQALVDCGATTIAVMRHLQMDVAAIDAIVVSHLHGDHFGGIPFLLMDACYNAPRTKLLTIVGPVGTRLRVMDTLGCLYPGAPAKVEGLLLRFIEFKDRESLAVGPLGVLPVPVVHPSGSTAYGLRINVGGRVVAFSGDTAMTPALAEIARDADLFICECYSYEKKIPAHTDFKTLETHVPRIAPRRLVLTHMSVDMLANRHRVAQETAEDGMVLTI